MNANIFSEDIDLYCNCCYLAIDTKMSWCFFSFSVLIHDSKFIGCLFCCREIAKHLSLPPVKLHCSMLAEDAIKAAVKDYETKRGKSVASTTEKAAEAWLYLSGDPKHRTSHALKQCLFPFLYFAFFFFSF